MMKNKFNYKILNPGGNKTAIVYGNKYSIKEKKLINKIILKENPEVEQVGFLNKEENRLEMAGGELCLNATRCAVWEYLKGTKGNIKLSVSGCDKEILGKIDKKNNVIIQLKIDKSIDKLIEYKKEFICVKLDGIVIVVLNEEKSKEYIEQLYNDEEKTKRKLKEIMQGLDFKEKAIGIMLTQREFGKIKINPIVWVKEIDTLYYETACGSGSLGTAIYNYLTNREKEIEIIQPSGYSISVKIIGTKKYIKNVSIRGIVIEE